MEGLRTSEATLCQHHLDWVENGDLLLFDRYYAFHKLMFQLIGKGAHFIMRMRDNWWKCAGEFARKMVRKIEYSRKAQYNQRKVNPTIKYSMNYKSI